MIDDDAAAVDHDDDGSARPCRSFRDEESVVVDAEGAGIPVPLVPSTLLPTCQTLHAVNLRVLPIQRCANRFAQQHGRQTPFISSKRDLAFDRSSSVVILTANNKNVIPIDCFNQLRHCSISQSIGVSKPRDSELVFGVGRHIGEQRTRKQRQSKFDAAFVVSGRYRARHNFAACLLRELKLARTLVNLARAIARACFSAYR